eukprot:1626766-Karenia_brevis.AAC.1
MVQASQHHGQDVLLKSNATDALDKNDEKIGVNPYAPACPVSQIPMQQACAASIPSLTRPEDLGASTAQHEL